MSKTYTNSEGRQVLRYDTPDSVLLDLPFIMTKSMRLTLNIPFMLLEGSHTTAVRLLDVSDANGIVYIDVQELQNGRTYTLSWNMEYEGEYWLWALADYDRLIKF